MCRPMGSLFAVRPQKLALWLAPLVVLSLMSGCRHRRSAYRPVILGPPAAIAPAAPCPSGDCGGGTLAPAEPAFSDPAAASPPPSPLGSEPVTPAGGGGTGGEPPFDPNTPGVRGSGNGNGNGVGGDLNGGPALEAPRSSLRPSRRAVGGAGREQGRRDVQAFVNDPADLFTPPRADRPWRYIVLHHSAHAQGGLAQIDRDHRERLGTLGCGYHFVVGNGSESPDGQVEVARRWSEQKGGAHCRDCQPPDANEYGIGICLVGNLDQSPPTAQQIEATRALVAYLQDRYQIPSANVEIHSQVARSATPCPGRQFPTQAILGNLDRSMASR